MKKKKSRTLFTVLICLAAFLLIFTLTVYGVVQSRTSSFIYTDMQTIPTTTENRTAIVLGASVLSNGDLSPILQDRADAAITLYNDHIVKTILVTGDNSALNHDEVDPVRKYLLKQGIPDSDIFLDHAGFDTYSSIYRAKYIFQVSSAIIVSQTFHLPRALYISQAIGLKAIGFSADNGHFTLYNYIREIPSDIKALFDLLTNQKPQYLGEIIPISSGSGSSGGSSGSRK